MHKVFLTPTETKGVFYDKGHPQVSSAIKYVFPPVGVEGTKGVAHFPPDDISHQLSEWNRFEIFLCWMLWFHMVGGHLFILLLLCIVGGIHFHIPSFVYTCNSVSTSRVNSRQQKFHKRHNQKYCEDINHGTSS